MTAHVANERHARIAALNDAFRTTFRGGRVMKTLGINSLPPATLGRIIRAVVTYDAWGPGNDPHREHDFGGVEVDGHKVFWKIDYYDDASMEAGSDDPADPDRTTRVLTIMLAQEY